MNSQEHQVPINFSATYKVVRFHDYFALTMPYGTELINDINSSQLVINSSQLVINYCLFYLTCK